MPITIRGAIRGDLPGVIARREQLALDLRRLTAGELPPNSNVGRAALPRPLAVGGQAVPSLVWGSAALPGLAGHLITTGEIVIVRDAEGEAGVGSLLPARPRSGRPPVMMGRSRVTGAASGRASGSRAPVVATAFVQVHTMRGLPPSGTQTDHCVLVSRGLRVPAGWHRWRSEPPHPGSPALMLMSVLDICRPAASPSAFVVIVACDERSVLKSRPWASSGGTGFCRLRKNPAGM